MAGSTTSLALRDGRVADVYLGGDPAGAALVMHHGTPSDATTFAGWDEICAAKNLRLICMSRPGYAGSTRAAGRDVAAAAGDIAALLGQLGVWAFYTAGWSGGGPHALACGALLKEHCLGVATLAGVGPYGVPDLDFVAGMGPENVEEFGAALAGEAELRASKIMNGAQAFRQVTGGEIVEAFGGLVPQIDKDVLTGGYADDMAAVMRRALAPGLDGWVDDDLAFTRPWGFELAEISAPVTVWQGDLDLMVPFSHGAWLASHIPSARFQSVPGHGHISLVVRYQAAILDELLAS